MESPSPSQLLTPLMIENNANEECSICYESYKNKAYVNDCLHNFCYVCIVSWAKIKPVCPLCVRPISGIITNIRSWNEYDIHSVDPPAQDLYSSIAALSDFGIPSDDTDTDSSYGGMESMISDFDYLPDHDDLSQYLTEGEEEEEEEDHGDAVSVNSAEIDNASVDNSYDEEDDKEDTDSESSHDNEGDAFFDDWNTEYDDDADDDDNDINDEEENNDEESEDDEDSNMYYDNELVPSDEHTDNDDENEELETSSNGSTSYSGEDSEGYNDNYVAGEPLEENDYVYDYVYNYCYDSNSIESFNEFHDIDSADEYGDYCEDSDDLCAYDDSPDYISSSNYY